MSRQGWKSGGGCQGTAIADAPRDAFGRVPLTRRQKAVVAAIRQHVLAHGWAPTCRELSELFGWSGPSAAHQQIAWLVKKGWIERMPGSARALRVVGEAP